MKLGYRKTYKCISVFDNWHIKPKMSDRRMLNKYTYSIRGKSCICMWQIRVKNTPRSPGTYSINGIWKCMYRLIFSESLTISTKNLNENYTKQYSCVEKSVNVFDKTSKWYFVSKIVLTYCEKNCSSDRENLWNSRLKPENLQKFWDH